MADFHDEAKLIGLNDGTKEKDDIRMAQFAHNIQFLSEILVNASMGGGELLQSDRLTSNGSFVYRSESSFSQFLSIHYLVWLYLVES